MVKARTKQRAPTKAEGVYSLLDAYETDLGTLTAVDVLGGRTGRQSLLNVAIGSKKGFSPRQRARAINLLGLLKFPKALKPCIQLLASKEEVIRVNAMYALGHFGDQSATRALQAALKNSRMSVIEKAHAVYILGEIGSAQTAKELQNFLSDEQDITLKKEALEAISAINKREENSAFERERKKP